ncbi:MAG: HNH endonuclease [Burkholderiales bacterium]|nr:HNH endonuclease [Burkholderiales bacterium]
MKVLKLSAQGLPQSWISLEEAVLHYAADEVRWEAGGEIAVFHGGHNAITGEQSVITVNSIIGTKGVPSINPFDLRPSLTNSKLFTRDRNVCAYCGVDHHETELTREHIIPFAQDGQDHWMNVVTACRLSPPNHSLPSRVGGCIPMRRRVLRHFWTGKDYEYGLRVRIYGRTAVGRVRGQS